jgi:1-acyl-sn-glycerol-3-phosphate acyltransferase
MKLLLWPLHKIYVLFTFLIFVLAMLLILPLCIIASFWGRVKGGNYIYKCCRFWADAFMLACGIKHSNIFAASHDTKEQYIFVANHISFMDIPIIFKCLRQQDFRVLGKYEMSKIPLFGFIYKCAVVMVDRSSSEARAKSVRELKSVIHKGISVFIFPEGTFNYTTEPLKNFYDGAFRIAIETQTPIKPIVFLDALERMHYRSVLAIYPGKSRAVFLPPVEVEGLGMQDMDALKQKVYDQMDAVLRTYKTYAPVEKSND